MNVTKNSILKGCLIASLSHAIMTNVYPVLAYEQSWDGQNYSIQDSQGLRGTITFEPNYCVGAIRNDNFAFARDVDFSERIISKLPLGVREIAERETLQYLLIDKDGKVIPAVTSVFWADSTSFNYSDGNQGSMQQDIRFLKKILLPEKEAIEEWKNYYDMNTDSLELLKYLLNEKKEDYFRKITLRDEQINLIPGSQLLDECVEAFKELYITIE